MSDSRPADQNPRRRYHLSEVVVPDSMPPDARRRLTSVVLAAIKSAVRGAARSDTAWGEAVVGDTAGFVTAIGDTHLTPAGGAQFLLADTGGGRGASSPPGRHHPARGRPASPEDRVGSQDSAQDTDDPRRHPRYIDNLFETVEYTLRGNKPNVALWHEGGRPMRAAIPADRIFIGNTVDEYPINTIFATADDADSEVFDWFLWRPGWVFVTYYRTPDDVVMPTLFTRQSAPKLHRFWQEIEQERQDLRQGAADIANMINPIPGTHVEATGEINMSSNPFDWLRLLHLRQLKEGEPRPRRPRLGPEAVVKTRRSIGIRYQIRGLPEDFESIKGGSVYVMKDASGTVLYVGEGDVFSRLASHLGDIKNTQVEFWGPSIATVEVHASDLSKIESLALEEDLIQQLKPVHNVDRMPFEKAHPGETRVGRMPRAQHVRYFEISLTE